MGRYCLMLVAKRRLLRRRDALRGGSELRAVLSGVFEVFARCWVYEVMLFVTGLELKFVLNALSCVAIDRALCTKFRWCHINLAASGEMRIRF
jgi:hypothetical protein